MTIWIDPLRLIANADICPLRLDYLHLLFLSLDQFIILRLDVLDDKLLCEKIFGTQLISPPEEVDAKINNDEFLVDFRCSDSNQTSSYRIHRPMSVTP